jgi:polyhydroxybutyrate depolymerase
MSQRREREKALRPFGARRGALVAVVMLVVTTCSSWSLVSVATASGSSILASGPARCGALTAGTQTLSIKVNGVRRTVVVHVPSGTVGGEHLPLVLNLHGSGSTAVDQEGFTGMDATSDAEGFIVAYPQAFIPDGSGFDWNVPGVELTGGRAVPANSPSDVEFLTSLVALLVTKYCADSSRVYATGFSGGAREVSQLACDDATIFAAVAPVSGLRYPTPCPAPRAVPVITFHGTADRVDPFDGNGQSYWTYSVKTAVKDWGIHDGCTKVRTTTPFHNVKLIVRNGCKDAADVELYEVVGEGHEWPSGPELPSSLTSLLGPQSNAVNANQVMWSFFKKYRLG